MGAPKIHLDEEARKQAGRDSRARWAKAHPDAIKRKNDRQNAARKAKRLAKKVVKVKPTTRVCTVCHTEKPFEQYKKHGVNGRSKECLSCNPVSTDKTHKSTGKRPIKTIPRAVTTFDKLASHEPKTPELVLGNWKAKFTADGWRCLGGVGDSHEQITVFIRGWIVMYIRGSKGSYSNGKTSFGVLFDDEKPRQLTLGKAEARARRLYESA